MQKNELKFASLEKIFWWLYFIMHCFKAWTLQYWSKQLLTLRYWFTPTDSHKYYQHPVDARSSNKLEISANLSVLKIQLLRYYQISWSVILLHLESCAVTKALLYTGLLFQNKSGISLKDHQIWDSNILYNKFDTTYCKTLLAWNLIAQTLGYHGFLLMVHGSPC